MGNNAFDDFVSKLNLGERMALYVTQTVGNINFVYLLLIIICFWMLANWMLGFVFDNQEFFLLFSIIAIIDFILTPFILVGQNLITKFNEDKEKVDFERNQNIELHLLKMEAMLNRLLPESEKRSITMCKNIERLDGTIDYLKTQIKDVFIEEVNKEEDSIDVFLQKYTGDMELDSLVMAFKSNLCNKISEVLVIVSASFHVMSLPMSWDIKGRQTATLLCQQGQEDKVFQMVERELKNKGLRIKWVE